MPEPLIDLTDDDILTRWDATTLDGDEDATDADEDAADADEDATDVDEDAADAADVDGTDA